MLFSCSEKRWEVEQVDIDFNERKTTPEMLRQYAEMEREKAVLQQVNDSLFSLEILSFSGEVKVGTNGSQEPSLLVSDDVAVVETDISLGKEKIIFRKR